MTRRGTVTSAVLAAGLLWATAVSAPAAAERWRPYANARFGFAIQRPADWQADPAPDNDDGRRFVSPDGRASITVSGSFRDEEDLARRSRPEQGETVTYRHRRGPGLVVSGTRGGTIFYRKSLLGCAGTIWVDLVIDYPAEQRTKLDPLVSHVAASLRPGRGGECGDKASGSGT